METGVQLKSKQAYLEYARSCVFTSIMYKPHYESQSGGSQMMYDWNIHTVIASVHLASCSECSAGAQTKHLWTVIIDKILIISARNITYDTGL